MQSYFYQPITNVLLMFIISLALAKYNLSYSAVKCSCGLNASYSFSGQIRKAMK